MIERKIVICDDNQIEAKKSKKIIERFERGTGDGCIITVYYDEKKLVEDCKTGMINPNMIFMDIELESGNGIEAAKEINKILPRCQIVYLSNSLKYATDAYQTNHIYFVIKPELEKRLPEIHKKISSLDLEQEKVLRLMLKGNKYVALKKMDIMYLERKGRYTFIYTKEGVYETHLTINELDGILNEDYFFRCHNSYIVSMRYITCYIREIITIKDMVNIPVSRRYQQIVKEKFANWVNGEIF